MSFSPAALYLETEALVQPYRSFIITECSKFDSMKPSITESPVEGPLDRFRAESLVLILFPDRDSNTRTPMVHRKERGFSENDHSYRNLPSCRWVVGGFRVGTRFG